MEFTGGQQLMSMSTSTSLFQREKASTDELREKALLKRKKRQPILTQTAFSL
jgi:hypothetical protein